MPIKPKSPCCHPGCTALTEQRYCARHDKKERNRHDQQRGTAASRGYGSKWQRYRKQYLQDHPLCISCECKGELTPANIVDHIIPHKGDQTLFWSPSNHQSLCKRCHDSKTAREDGGFRNK
ncbi:MAG: HNH endonuclease [Negativicutes bacterium]|nr:HNH endonuclease [Negativicutes bacterium]